MKEIVLYILSGLSALAALSALFLSGNLSPVPGLGLILVVSAVLQGWVALRLHRTWKRLSLGERAANPILNQLRWLFAIGGTFLALDIIPHVLLIIIGVNVQIITIAHWTAHIILFIYLVMAARLSISYFNPRWRNVATIFVIAVGLAALFVSAMRPDTLINIPGSAYPLLASHPLYAIFNTLLNVASAGIFGAYLVVMSFFQRDSSTMIRALLLGMGFLCIVVMGYIIHFSHTPMTPLYIYTAAIGWSLFTGLSALSTASRRSAEM